jgi:acyl-CoA thioester hydrolase
VTYVHSIRVRYGECDMQKVVFNAHYMAYCDDAVDTWFRSVLAPDGSGFESLGFDFMLKSMSITWDGPLRFGDTAELHCSLARVGNSSFDVSIVGSVGGASRFTSTITYVSVRPGTTTPSRVPPLVRERLA